MYKTVPWGIYNLNPKSQRHNHRSDTIGFETDVNHVSYKGSRHDLVLQDRAHNSTCAKVRYTHLTTQPRCPPARRSPWVLPLEVAAGAWEIKQLAWHAGLWRPLVVFMCLCLALFVFVGGCLCVPIPLLCVFVVCVYLPSRMCMFVSLMGALSERSGVTSTSATLAGTQSIK